jgi:hypothetical protein
LRPSGIAAGVRPVVRLPELGILHRCGISRERIGPNARGNDTGIDWRGLALDGCTFAGAVHVSVDAVHVSVEQSLRRATGDHGVRHCVRVLLVRVAALTDAPLQLHAPALLYDVRCLVGGGV